MRTPDTADDVVATDTTADMDAMDITDATDIGIAAARAAILATIRVDATAHSRLTAFPLVAMSRPRRRVPIPPPTCRLVTRLLLR